MGLPNSGVQAKVEMLQLKMEDGWAYPMEELKEKISSNTKLVAVQSPGHNPTGNNYDIKAFLAIPNFNNPNRLIAFFNNHGEVIQL